MTRLREAYFMDDAREANRLAAKVDADAWVDRYFAHKFADAKTVLDVGCGPGTLASAVGKRLPHACITGIDLSTERIQAEVVARPPNVSLRRGDAHGLDLPNDFFDVVYCRFLLQYLALRQQAVEEMVRVCAPGGTVMLQDLDGQLLWHYPEDRSLQADLEFVLAGLGKTGFDPFVGRKLFALARTAGLVALEVQVESYHLFAGAIDPVNLRLWEMKLEIALAATSSLFGDQAAAESLKSRFLAYLKRDDTLTYSVVFTVTGRKPRRQA